MFVILKSVVYFRPISFIVFIARKKNKKYACFYSYIDVVYFFLETFFRAVENLRSFRTISLKIGRWTEMVLWLMFFRNIRKSFYKVLVCRLFLRFFFFWQLLQTIFKFIEVFIQYWNR